MTNGVKTQMMGWGANIRVECLLDRPQSARDIAESIDRNGTIARGLGRSYGDAALNAGKQVLELTRLNRYVAFDPEQGILTCEAGVSLADIIQDFMPRGWFPAITPGTKYVTIGGCIANDIHGKAHHTQGSFAQCLRSMTILLASGEVLTASREENADLFWGTLGGMGLLGVILTATITLRRIETCYFNKTVIKTQNLDEMLAAFEETKHVPYSVAWTDPFSTGDQLGRGVLTIGDHASLDELPPKLRARPLKLAGPPKITVPFELPQLALNKLSVKIVNAYIEMRLSQEKPLAHYDDFFYPLDLFGHWYRGYGPRGFTQYQFVIPYEDGPKNLRALLTTIATSGQLPFLNILKTLGPASGGTLSFPHEGYTFAIDFPVRPGLLVLLERLDKMVLDAGGRVYLGKDAYLKAETFQQMYPQLEQFLALKNKYDPENVFTSDLARRIGLIPQ